MSLCLYERFGYKRFEMKKKGQLEIVGQFVDGMEAMRSGV